MSITNIYIITFYFLDNTLPNACNPVVVLKKTTTAVLQTYNLPVPDPENRVSNLFDDIEDLFSVVCFQSDIVIDTTLEGKIFSILHSCVVTKYYITKKLWSLQSSGSLE